MGRLRGGLLSENLEGARERGLETLGGALQAGQTASAKALQQPCVWRFKYLGGGRVSGGRGVGGGGEDREEGGRWTPPEGCER